ncbi:LysR family transcriptional regulator [Streptomyces sp. NPDC048404]|uniref:helix-turn-helix domain-containing protein n=1 Tax=unclassified Streptomyces TaxID=2593676 RepID=UPI003425F0F9
MLDVEQLEALQAMARAGSLTRAAEMLDVTPLAVCQQLAKLEEDLGQPVLQPYGRTIRLTRAALLFSQKMNLSSEPESASPCHRVSAGTSLPQGCGSAPSPSPPPVASTPHATATWVNACRRATCWQP